MKKITLTLVALVCALCCAFGLAACDNGDNHTHDYATTWSKNATHHWHECQNDGCDAKEKDKAAHDDTNGDGKCNVCEYVISVAVTGVTLNKNELTLEIDDEETLTATVAPDNATNKTVTWSSSAPTIASVDNTGKVTAKAEGTATVTATTANNKTATCAVTVNAPAPTTEVTAEQWAQILDGANNYTYTQTFTDYSGENKIDGNKWELDDGEFVHQIIVKNGTAYDVYMENTDPAGWSKTTVSGNSSSVADLEMQFDFAQNMLKVCKDDYSLFDYDDGKYTAAEIDKTATIGIKLQNIVAIFEQGKLVSITFSMGGAEYEFTDFGSTTITLPITYTESND